MKIAQDQELDLVEISPQADPPVCKVIDYNNSFTIRRRRKRK
jgi:translation initiation factor IF-3